MVDAEQSDLGVDAEPGEDDGVLAVADSLADDDLNADELDTGVEAGTRYTASTSFGTTAAEEARGESLDQLLAEEEPDLQVDSEWTDEDEPSDEDNVPLPRSGRLVAPDEGAHPDEETDALARDVGRDGGAASAEEAAVHLTVPPRYV